MSAAPVPGPHSAVVGHSSPMPALAAAAASAVPADVARGAIAASGAIPAAAAGAARSLPGVARAAPPPGALPPQLTKEQFAQIVDKLKRRNDVYPTLKEAYSFSSSSDTLTYPQFVNALTPDQRKALKELGCKVEQPFLLPYPDAMPAHSYSAGVTNGGFAEVLHLMQQEGKTVGEALAEKKFGRNSFSSIEAFKATLTPIGRELLGKVSPADAFPLESRDGERVRNVKETVAHRGVLCTRTITHVKIDGWSWENVGRIAALFFTIVFLGLPCISEDVRKFHQETWDGLSAQKPRYAEIPEGQQRTNQYLATHGFTPERQDSVSDLWERSVARQPDLLKVTSMENPFQKGFRYLHRGHELLYTGEGVFIIKNTGKLTILELYDDKTGKPWEEGPKLLQHLVVVENGLKPMLKSKARHFTTDMNNRTVHQFPRAPELNGEESGHKFEDGTEVPVDRRVWGKGKTTPSKAKGKNVNLTPESIREALKQKYQLSPYEMKNIPGFSEGPLSGQSLKAWQESLELQIDVMRGKLKASMGKVDL